MHLDNQRVLSGSFSNCCQVLKVSQSPLTLPHAMVPFYGHQGGSERLQLPLLPLGIFYPNCNPFSNFRFFGLPLQGPLHLSLAVLVHYRALASI